MHKTEEMDNTKKFTELFCELEDCDKDEQKQKIEEMNEMINEMNGKEFRSVFTTELFNKIHQMIKEEKLPLENAILLLKHIGYCKVMRNMWVDGFKNSSLSEKIQNMIIEEYKKKGGKIEKLFVNLCECIVLLGDAIISDEILSIIVPCLLKATLKKEKSEEMQKETKMVFLALSCFDMRNKSMKQEWYLNEIKAIIQYHQEHHNLTRPAYQIAWKFLIDRTLLNKGLNEVIVNELHFWREAAKELEVFAKCVNWKGEKGDREKEMKEAYALMKWFEKLEYFLCFCSLWNEEFAKLINSIVQVFRATKDNYIGISWKCFYLLREAAKREYVRVDDLLKSGAVDVALEEMKQSTLIDKMTYLFITFLMLVLMQLKEEEKEEMKEQIRKEVKRKVFEKMEEEGYYDVNTSFCETLHYLNSKYFCGICLNVSDYFVNI